MAVILGTSRLPLAAAVAMVAPLWACTDPTPDSTGVIEVQATTDGGTLDPDGYRVTLDGSAARQLSPTALTRFFGVSEGSHNLALSEVAANCAVADGLSRTVLVGAGDTAAASFQVSCAAGFASIRVRTMTTGADIDPNGYSVLVDDTSRGSVASTGITQIALTPGSHAIRLSGLVPNCTQEGDTAPAVTVDAGATATVDVTIVCQESSLYQPAQQVAFLTARDNQETTGAYDLYLMNADGTGLKKLLPDRNTGVAWAPGGGRFALGEGTHYSVVSVDDTGRVVTKEDSFEEPEAFILGASWAPDGRLVFSEGFDDATLLDLGFSQTLYCCNVTRESPSWSPDGARIVFAIRNPAPEAGFPPEARELWMADPLSGNVGPLADPPVLGGAPAWSPDGLRIAFDARAPGAAERDIYLVDADGAHLTQLTDAPGDDTNPSWSPTGAQLVFVSHRDGNAEIYVMNADGSEPVRITNDPASDSVPVWRP